MTRILAGCLYLATCLALASCDREPRQAPPDYYHGAEDYSGKLLVSIAGDNPPGDTALVHHSRFVNNRHAQYMEDNDIRGFLDGNFVWGWNQPGQVHVRVGRKDKNPRFGEYELFRVTYRWQPLPLPRAARVLDTGITIHVEVPSEYPSRVYLYSVLKDWNPGSGGILHNNISPPAAGEVWWNDAAYQQMAWGLPGAGFASDTLPSADTPGMPLAAVDYTPGDESIRFSSARLTSYIQKRVSEHAPLLLLLKLSDFHEDIPGVRFTPYSGNTGDDRNTPQRPALEIDWTLPAVAGEYRYDYLLEYGRDHEFPRIPLHGERLVIASLQDSSNPLPPQIDYRSGHAGSVTGWVTYHDPVSVDAEWIQFRIRAVHDPVILGEPFSASLRDTWILTAPPEEQHVPWHFIAPSGREFTVPAGYKGDFMWSVTFTPDELGPWRYYWENTFSGKYTSTVGRFDVIIGSRENAIRQLENFRDLLPAHSAGKSKATEIDMYRFAKLERAVMGTLDPASFTAATGRNIRQLLNEIRGRLGKKPPEEVKLKANPPFEWERRHREHVDGPDS